MHALYCAVARLNNAVSSFSKGGGDTVLCYAYVLVIVTQWQCCIMYPRTLNDSAAVLHLDPRKALHIAYSNTVVDIHIPSTWLHIQRTVAPHRMTSFFYITITGISLDS